MKDSRFSPQQLSMTALATAVLCILGPLSVPIGAIPISLTNLAICLAAWLLGSRLGTLSVLVYLLLGAVGLPVFSGYGAGLAKLLGPTGGYLVGFLLTAWIGGLFIEKSGGRPLLSGLGLVLGIGASYLLGTAWFVFQMQTTLASALAVCVYPFIPFDLLKVVLCVGLGPLLRRRLQQAGFLRLP